jgi:hypothetical protein
VAAHQGKSFLIVYDVTADPSDLLGQLFGWQTFKRVGASLTINRIYKIVLVMSITIQLCFFFVVVTVSLWIDQLLNSAIGDLAEFQMLYKAASIITLVVSSIRLFVFSDHLSRGQLWVPWFLTVN